MFALKKVFVVMIATGLPLTACGGQRATEVKVTLKEFTIESSLTEFQVGVRQWGIGDRESACTSSGGGRGVARRK